MTWSPAPDAVSGTGYTAATARSGWREMIDSTGPAEKFSESTRSQSPVRPAK